MKAVLCRIDLFEKYFERSWIRSRRYLGGSPSSVPSDSHGLRFWPSSIPDLTWERPRLRPEKTRPEYSRKKQNCTVYVLDQDVGTFKGGLSLWIVELFFYFRRSSES
jgi:hypothetical protein